jgi:hypothetical protein
VERDSLYNIVHRPDDEPEADAPAKRLLRVV